MCERIEINMKFHTFGDEKNQVMILLHGMLNPWQIWEDAAAYFSKEYYVIVPELDGHTETEKSSFVSVEEEAEAIRKYVIENFDGKISALCGLSMGGRIAAILAGMPGISVDALVLDGAPLQKLPGLFRTMIKNSYRMVIEKSKGRDPKILERAKKEFLPERYLDAYLKVADHMDEENIPKIIDSVFRPFEFKAYGDQVRILFLHGTKGNEKVSAKAAKCMKEANPQTEIRCFQGYGHAQLASFEIDKWIQEVAAFLGHAEG